VADLSRLPIGRPVSDARRVDYGVDSAIAAERAGTRLRSGVPTPGLGVIEPCGLRHRCRTPCYLAAWGTSALAGRVIVVNK
jgi:hypothetical protein